MHNFTFWKAIRWKIVRNFLSSTDFPHWNNVEFEIQFCVYYIRGPENTWFIGKAENPISTIFRCWYQIYIDVNIEHGGHGIFLGFLLKWWKVYLFFYYDLWLSHQYWAIIEHKTQNPNESLNAVCKECLKINVWFPQYWIYEFINYKWKNLITQNPTFYNVNWSLKILFFFQIIIVENLTCHSFTTAGFSWL